MPERKKPPHFLPAVPLYPPHRPLIIPPPEKQQPRQSFFSLTRHPLRTEEAQRLLNQKARKAALAGIQYLTEKYRKEGASLMAFARDVGISGQLKYAEFLVKQNPQEKRIIDEIALGFYVGDHIKSFRYFCATYNASFYALIERAGQSRYGRPEGVKYNVLAARLQHAHESFHQDSYIKKYELEFSSSDESFTLSD